MKNNFVFSNKIILWYLHINTHELPWQLNKTMYNIWISEIMLQQTQVLTVITYYKKFIKKFPTISQIAKAELNEILYLWSGLGYYRRAINLHKTAQIILKNYSGQFPSDLKILASLPGIGKSTAGAILSLALNQPYPILDSNIKRILIRYYSLNNNTIQKSIINNQLWSMIETLIPSQNASIFNQAMMNLGRLICTYKKPVCHICPINKHCQSFLTQKITQYASIKNKNIKKKSKRTIWWLLLVYKTNRTKVWLIKRSQNSIWQELFCFPEFYNFDMLNQWLLNNHYQNIIYRNMTAVKYYISNIHLEIQPIFITINKTINLVNTDGIWYDLDEPIVIGLPKPVSIMLSKIKSFLLKT